MDDEKSTPCQCKKCYLGYVTIIKDLGTGEGHSYWTVNELCSCCGGEYWDCKNCCDDMPDAITAVEW